MEEEKTEENASSSSEKSLKKDETDTNDISIPKDDTKDNSRDEDEYGKHVSYEADGTAIYTDPKTNYKYKWCTEKSDWVALETPTENEHYRWCSESNKWIPKESVSENEFYKWDAEKNEWVPKAEGITYGIDRDGQRTYTDKDGAVFFWDTEKKAWFPKIDDDFMAIYQMNYGYSEQPSASQEKDVPKEEVKEEKTPVEEKTVVGKRKAQEAKWFDLDPNQNTKVYISNLPIDITEEEFIELMGKCGMIMKDPKTQKHKIKLYVDSNGYLKGDGLCDYIKVESVELALNILDGYDFRGHKIKVQRAKFEMRGEYNPALKPKKKKGDKEKLQKIKEKLFDWRPEKMRGERGKHERTVIIKNLFTPELFDKEVHLIIDYQNDLREECSKCGTVRKVIVYDRHQDGVAQVTMSDPSEADLVVQMMNGRFFGQRKLTAELWDGKAKYKVEETEEEAKRRLQNWDKHLEETEAATSVKEGEK